MQFTTNNGYVFETCAHWISAYFLGEQMRIPSSDADAIAITEKNAAWYDYGLTGSSHC